MSRPRPCLGRSVSAIFAGGNEKWFPYLWLDYRAVMTAVCRDHHELVGIKYFTAMARQPESKKRQQAYLKALEINGGIDLFTGRIVQRPHTCEKCEKKSHREQEKETDVKMASEMLLNAFDGRMDEVWLVT